jgi:hypothetical protein
VAAFPACLSGDVRWKSHMDHLFETFCHRNPDLASPRADQSDLPRFLANPHNRTVYYPGIDVEQVRLFAENLQLAEKSPVRQLQDLDENR